MYYILQHICVRLWEMEMMVFGANIAVETASLMCVCSHHERGDRAKDGLEVV